VVDGLIVEASWQGHSGIPRDRFVNTFHFTAEAGAKSANDGANACGRVADFYMGVTGAGHTVSSMLSPEMTVCTLNAYDLAAAKPRPILFHATITRSPGSDGPMPEEVALCLSYYSTRNIPRERGRIYIGPLNVGTLGGAGVSGQSLPNALLTNAMKDAAVRLATTGDGVSGGGFFDITPTITTRSCSWVLFSRADAATKLISAGWIDNEWDVQHRRRIAATARTTWVGGP
jgi:hypothetical protein